MPDVTLKGRDHRAMLRHLATIEKHHTRRLDGGRVVEPAFPHDDDAHEEGQCPQCEVLTAVFALRDLLRPVEEAVGEPRKIVSITREEAQAIEDRVNERKQAGRSRTSRRERP